MVSVKMKDWEGRSFHFSCRSLFSWRLWYCSLINKHYIYSLHTNAESFEKCRKIKPHDEGGLIVYTRQSISYEYKHDPNITVIFIISQQSNTKRKANVYGKSKSSHYQAVRQDDLGDSLSCYFIFRQVCLW